MQTKSCHKNEKWLFDSFRRHAHLYVNSIWNPDIFILTYLHVQFVFTFSCLWESRCLIYVICVCLRIVVSNAWCCCLRLVCPNVACFSGLSILCCPFALSNMLLPRSLLEWSVALFYCLYVRDYVWAFIASIWNISKIIWRQKDIHKHCAVFEWWVMYEWR